VLEIRGRGHVLVGEPREPGVVQANAMQSVGRTFACPFCPVVKGSRMAFRVHLGLHHNSDLRTVRQVDGSFRDQVVRLFGRELGSGSAAVGKETDILDLVVEPRERGLSLIVEIIIQVFHSSLSSRSLER